MILPKYKKLLKTLNDWHPKKKWLSKQKNDLIQIKKVVRNHSTVFKNIFYTNAAPMQNVLLPILTPFTSSEIRKSVRTLKNNKNPRMDRINVELMKYSPKVVYKKVADIYNNMQPQESTQMRSYTEF